MDGKNTTATEGMSRRDFLKVTAIAAGGVTVAGGGLVALDKTFTSLSKSGNTRRNLGIRSEDEKKVPELIPPAAKVYEGKLMADTLTIEGVRVVFPVTKGGDGQNVNLKWEESELAILADELKLLPRVYKKSLWSVKEILLYKVQGMRPQPSASYNLQQMELFIPEDFSPNDDAIPSAVKKKDVYGSQANQLRAAIWSESARLLTEADPRLIASWAESTGWTKDRFGRLMRPNLSDELVGDPREDLLLSVGLMRINPRLLTSYRQKFLLDKNLVPKRP